ncbi:hypothetical protein QBC40DRAFT_258449 [Triangularia verruculosa]|uniref:Uncharacterized protein n=1 Tax=Triangularia verruculosa TaxID=2587418 RepID=A0AAN6X8D0_9PEZI|nr:hypothetical protein QBC40DRAFT_258449 [Triangularia verruculosa]
MQDHKAFTAAVRESNAWAREKLIKEMRPETKQDTATAASSSQEKKKSKKKNPMARSEYITALEAWHSELDALREDWALEVLGRLYMFAFYQDPTDFQRAYKLIHCRTWTYRFFLMGGRITGPLYRRVHNLRHPNSAVCRLSMDCVPWRKVQDEYIERKRAIDAKYARPLGNTSRQEQVHNNLRRRVNRQFFPFIPSELFNNWSPFYLGQQCVHIRAETVQTPPDRSWITKVSILDREGKPFWSAHFAQAL